MKKLIVSFSMLFLFLNKLEAQEFSAGLKAGGQLSNVTYRPSIVGTPQIYFGYQGGAYGKFQTPTSIGAKLEIFFSQKGSNIDVPLLGRDKITSSFRTRYIDMPVLATVNFLKVLTLEAGPQFSYLINGETTTVGTTFDYEPNNDLEIGWCAGLNASLPKNLGIYIRYNQSFNFETTTVNAVSGPVIVSNRDVLQYWFQLGCNFKLIGVD